MVSVPLNTASLSQQKLAICKEDPRGYIQRLLTPANTSIIRACNSWAFKFLLHRANDAGQYLPPGA